MFKACFFNKFDLFFQVAKGTLNVLGMNDVPVGVGSDMIELHKHHVTIKFMILIQSNFVLLKFDFFLAPQAPRRNKIFNSKDQFDF